MTKIAKKSDPLLTIDEAAALYNIPVEAVRRMYREGLIQSLGLGDVEFVLGQEIMRVARLAEGDHRFLTCTCQDGPCECPITE